MKLKIELIAAKVPVDFHNGVKILLAYDDYSVVRHMELPVIDWLVGYSVESMSSIETRAVINSMSFLQHGIRCYSYCFLDVRRPQNGSDVSNVSKNKLWSKQLSRWWYSMSWLACGVTVIFFLVSILTTTIEFLAFTRCPLWARLSTF